MPFLCELLKPLSDFVALLRSRITMLGRGNRFVWGHREEVSYQIYLGLGFLIWKRRQSWTRLATHFFVVSASQEVLWWLPSNLYCSGDFVVVCFVLNVQKIVSQVGVIGNPLECPLFKVLFLGEHSQK